MLKCTLNFRPLCNVHAQAERYEKEGHPYDQRVVHYCPHLNQQGTMPRTGDNQCRRQLLV